MGDIISDGRTRAAFLLAIANIASVTTLEADAGMLLHPTMTDDGLINFKPTTNSVPNRKLASDFNTVDVGSVAVGDTGLRFYKQDGTDTIYDTLVYRLAGFVVIRRSIDAGTAWASGQPIQVWPVRCGEVSWLDPEADTEERYEIPMKVTTKPNLRAVIA